MCTMELRRNLVFFDASSENLRRKIFGIVLGVVAKKFHVSVVPTIPQVIGHAVYDHEMIAWIVNAATRKLHHVAMTDPYQQLPGVHRLVELSKGPDPEACNAHTVFVRIEAA